MKYKNLLIAYVIVSIITFGHVANREDPNTPDGFIKIILCVIFWPLYASYEVQNNFIKSANNHTMNYVEKEKKPTYLRF